MGESIDNILANAKEFIDIADAGNENASRER